MSYQKQSVRGSVLKGTAPGIQVRVGEAERLANGDAVLALEVSFKSDKWVVRRKYSDLLLFLYCNIEVAGQFAPKIDKNFAKVSHYCISITFSFILGYNSPSFSLCFTFNPLCSIYISDLFSCFYFFPLFLPFPLLLSSSSCPNPLPVSLSPLSPCQLEQQDLCASAAQIVSDICQYFNSFFIPAAVFFDVPFTG